MSTQTTTDTSPYGRIGTIADPVTLTVEVLGAQWEVTYKLGVRNSYSGELALGSAHTAEVKINGVRYRGAINFTWDPATGDIDYSLGRSHYDWERLAADGTTREHGLTDAANAQMQNAARTLAKLFPAPTPRDVRDMIANWAHTSARKSVEELEKGMGYVVESMGPAAKGLRWTIAEAFAAEFRRAFDQQGVEKPYGWVALPEVTALGGEDWPVPGVKECVQRADREAEAAWHDEQARIARVSVYTAARDRERAIEYGTAKAEDLRKAGNDVEAERYEERVARLRAAQDAADADA